MSQKRCYINNLKPKAHFPLISDEQDRLAVGVSVRDDHRECNGVTTEDTYNVATLGSVLNCIITTQVTNG